MNVDVIPGEGSISESAELNDKASVYFFANKDSNNNIIATHMGYIPASSSAKYAKYVELGSGKITSSLEGTFNTSILPEGIVKETIKYSSFNYQPTKEGYSELGTYTGTYGTYKGKAFTKPVNDENPYDLLQIRNSDHSGILMSDSTNQIKYVAINWADHQHTSEGDSIDVFGSYKLAYEKFDEPTVDPVTSIEYPNVLTLIEDEIYFTRIIPNSGATVIESLDIYFDSNAAKPNIPSNINFSYNGNSVSSILTKDVTNPITINTDTPVTFTAETLTGSVVVSIADNVITNTNNEAGIVRLTATSTIDPDLSKTIDVEYRPLANYTYGLVNDISDLTDGSKIVLVSSSRNSYMGGLDNNHHKNITTVSDPDGVTSYSSNNLEFNFNSYSEAQILTLRTVELEGIKYYAFEVETLEGKKYLREYDDNKLIYGDLSKANGEFNTNVLFTIDEINIETGEVLIKCKEEPTRAIRLNGAANANRFGTYAINNDSFESVAIYKENANTNFTVSRIECSAKQYLKVRDTTQITTNFYPTFATSSKDLTYTVSGDPAITVSPEGLVTAVATGTSNVEVKCGEVTFTLTFYVDEAVNSLVESVNELEENKLYAIVASDYDVAMSSDKGNNRNQSDIVKNEKLLFLVNNDVELFTLEHDDNSNTYKFKDVSGKYLTAQEKDENYLYSKEESNEYSNWNITIDSNGKANIISAVEGCKRNKIFYNNQGKLFSCYANDNENMKSISLYRIETVQENIPFKISLSEESKTIQLPDINTHSIRACVVDYFGNEVQGETTTATINPNKSVITEVNVTNNTISFKANEPGTVEIIISGNAVANKTLLIEVLEERTDEFLNPLTINKEYSGVLGNSYSDWAKKYEGIVTVKGTSAGGNSSIQLRTSDNKSGVIVNVNSSNFKISRIEIKWNSNTTDGRKINIYKNVAPFNLPSDLYESSKQGTLEETCVKSTSNSIVDINSNYIGIKSQSGALYLDSITIYFEKVN